MTHIKQSTITKKQIEILQLLIKYRFLNTKHIQKFLGHKNPKRIQIWLKDLKDKECITTISGEKKDRTFTENAKPYIYRLTSKSLPIIRAQSQIDQIVLEKVYKEGTRSQKFVDHCLAIADIALCFLSQRKENEKVTFITSNQLQKYDYFPQPFPSAYMAVKTPEKTKRYFLEIFDEYTPSFVLRAQVKKYMKYVTNGEWEAYAKDQPIPTILFILPNQKKKTHINMYAKALFEKNHEETIRLFLTTKDTLLKNKPDMWEKVTVKE